MPGHISELCSHCYFCPICLVPFQLPQHCFSLLTESTLLTKTHDSQSEETSEKDDTALSVECTNSANKLVGEFIWWSYSNYGWHFHNFLDKALWAHIFAQKQHSIILAHVPGFSVSTRPNKYRWKMLLKAWASLKLHPQQVLSLYVRLKEPHLLENKA